MKELLIQIVNDYLKVFPEETERQEKFFQYLNSSVDEQITDWNNFNGHIVAGGFIYSKKEKKFLVLYHKDLEMFLYPGGHVDSHDKNPLEAALREIKEETGISNLTELKVAKNSLVPMDIDTQRIKYNERLNLKEHDHYDFRYLFMIDKIPKIEIDTLELSSYQWIDVEQLSKHSKYGWIAKKINILLSKVD